MRSKERPSRYHLARVIMVTTLWCSFPAQAQIGGKDITGFDAARLRTVLGVDFATLPATSEQKSRVMSGKQKHYIVFDGERLSNLAAGSDQYWNGTVLIPSPEKTGKLIQVSVKERTWSYSGWWYKNKDGSIARIFKDGAGFKVGVVTIAGDGSSLAVIDLDYDGVAESVEQVFPGGRTVLLTDREGLRMQQLWLTGHNPFCTLRNATPKGAAGAKDAPSIGVPDDRAAIGLCMKDNTAPGISTDRPARPGSGAKRGPNTIEQMCAGIRGGPGVPGVDFARDDEFPVTTELIRVVYEGTDGHQDGAGTQALRAMGMSVLIMDSAVLEFMIHEFRTVGGLIPSHHNPPPGPRPGPYMPAGPAADEFCRTRDDQSKRWDVKIAGAQAAVEKECPNPASQPVPAATRDKAEQQSVSIYCSSSQRQDSRDRAETASLFAVSSNQCGIAERPGPGGTCRQRTFHGSGGHVVVGYGDTLIFQACPEETCGSPER